MCNYFDFLNRHSDNLKYLKEIFPQLSEDTLKKSLESKSGKVSDVIEKFCETGNSSEGLLSLVIVIIFMCQVSLWIGALLGNGQGV